MAALALSGAIGFFECAISQQAVILTQTKSFPEPDQLDYIT